MTARGDNPPLWIKPGNDELKDKSQSKSNTLYYWIPAVPVAPTSSGQRGPRE